MLASLKGHQKHRLGHQKARCAASQRLPPGSKEPFRARATNQQAAFRDAGPKTAVPDYRAIDAQPLNQVIMALFRQKMVAAVGQDSKETGYAAIIDLTRKLNSKYQTPRETQVATRGILKSLFPSWLPGAFAVLISAPFPAFSSKMNAWATALTCQWLMGPCKVNDVEIDGGKIAQGHGVIVERCRYLEQAGCASICINSCKVPTQEFFAKDMGLPLTMTPNYDDFSCQFSFGKTPIPETQDEAFVTPCFTQCPSKKRAAGEQAAAGCHKIQPNAAL